MADEFARGTTITVAAAYQFAPGDTIMIRVPRRLFWRVLGRFLGLLRRSWGERLRWASVYAYVRSVAHSTITVT